jgi:hypothetical protein
MEIYRPYLSKLWMWVDSQALNPRCIAWVCSLSGSRGQIHTDLGPTDLALQLPVKNCRDTDTVIYRSLGPPQLVLSKPVGYYWADKDVEEISRYTLMDRPIIFNIKHPHSVVNRSKMARQAISVRFEKDPWFLVDK